MHLSLSHDVHAQTFPYALVICRNRGVRQIAQEGGVVFVRYILEKRRLQIHVGPGAAHIEEPSRQRIREATDLGVRENSYSSSNAVAEAATTSS